MDFVAIGDTTVDEFIRLKDARITCDINHEECTISMKWGDKIPYEFSTRVPGVGNAANAAVAAARLGLSSALVAHVGDDAYGAQILDTFARERVETHHVTRHAGMPTNHHFVLWYEAERTILIHQTAYPYTLPRDLIAPAWLYLSSMGEAVESFYTELVAWLIEHPETKLAFQPGTFQIALGTQKLASLYAHTELVACNKQEAERILELGESDIVTLVKGLRALGPRIALVTDGPKGAYASDGTEMLKVPMYPDPKPPYERTGAGDACTATIVAALALGKPLDEAFLWGPINAMAVVQEIGAQKGLLSRSALENYLRQAPAEYRVESFG